MKATAAQSALGSQPAPGAAGSPIQASSAHGAGAASNNRVPTVEAAGTPGSRSGAGGAPRAPAPTLA
jgi:hypothetical protein